MDVDTKRVAGRRQIRFSNYQEILDEVRDLAGRPTKQLGNWSLGAVCDHLASAMNMAVDGSSIRVSWTIRVVGPWIKNRMLTRPMSPGFRLPRNAALLFPATTDTAAGVAALERAIERLQNSEVRRNHFVFGPMTREEWDQLHFRHCEMHLGFIVPE